MPDNETLRSKRKRILTNTPKRDMKKILCLIDGLGFGGAQRQLIGLVHLLKERGYDVTLASYHYKDFYSELLSSLSIEPVLLAHRGNQWSKLKAVAGFVKDKGFDVVITYLQGPNRINALLRLLGSKHLAVVSDRVTLQRVDRKCRLHYFLYRFADAVVPNSHSQAAFIEKNFPSLKGKVHTITNFTDTNHFLPATNEGGREVAEIAIAGRISREKNLLTFMDAVAELKRRGVAVHFSWYGNVGGGQEEYSREVAERYEELAIEDYLTFHRGTDKIVEVYQGCDAFCLPSLYEGFPNVVCEAMSCARPVLCSRVCDNPLIVEEGESGYLFNPESATDMADTVERFVGLPTEERRRMGERGRQLAEERFSEESFVEAYIELIK